MTTRRATRADISVIRERLAELPHPPYLPTDDDVAEMWEARYTVAIVNDVTGAFGQARYSEVNDLSTVVFLLPEAAGKRRTAPLALELLEGLYLIPVAQQKPLEGVFSNGFDARGKEDKGEGKADAWVSMVNGNGRFDTGLEKDTVRSSLGNITGYRVTWVLHDLLMRFRELVRG